MKKLTQQQKEAARHERVYTRLMSDLDKLQQIADIQGTIIEALIEKHGECEELRDVQGRFDEFPSE